VLGHNGGRHVWRDHEIEGWLYGEVHGDAPVARA
jgi:hypothetical protein